MDMESKFKEMADECQKLVVAFIEEVRKEPGEAKSTFRLTIDAAGFHFLVEEKLY